MQIREYDAHVDNSALQACIVELQDFEKQWDPRMPAGLEMADAYLAQMIERCEKCAGKILVAIVKNQVIGFITVLTRVRSESLEDGDLEFGLIADLVVLETQRGIGYGRALLAAPEAHAQSENVRWLRIGVMADNQRAKFLYNALGFADLHVSLEKTLLPPD